MNITRHIDNKEYKFELTENELREVFEEMRKKYLQEDVLMIISEYCGVDVDGISQEIIEDIMNKSDKEIKELDAKKLSIIEEVTCEILNIF